jgi:two-component system chemotaxis response regulator CheB
MPATTKQPPLAIVFGASMGGVEALLTLAASLPSDFPAIVCMVLHVGSHQSILPELLRARTGLRAVHPQDGQRAAAGTIYVAPPDHHLLLEGDVLRLSRGPRENLARPAIDPLFRSAAVHWRERAVGVVLTGRLDDGAAGLAAIKAAGGRAVVQNPAEAPEPEMPLAALAATAVDACLPLGEMARYLLELVHAKPVGAAGQVPAVLERELAINLGDNSMDQLDSIGDVSRLTCPECGGALWEMRDAKPLRYRCHTGHAFSAASLAYGQARLVNSHLWGGARSLRERAMLLRRMQAVARGTGDAVQAAAIQAQADRVSQRAAELEAMLQEEASGVTDASA